MATYKTKEDVLRRAQAAVGIPLNEIDKTGRLSTGKGAIGSVLEESWFGYSINSESRPDFPEAGVELKATPYCYTQKGDLRAKERLVCNIINYMEEYKNTFKTSSFWTKCNTMLIMSYEHKNNAHKSEFTIDSAILFGFPKEDLIIIEKDWETIIGKVRAGKAHEISEGDTLYLGACTKGATAKSVGSQPFSSIMAKQRAYSLKQSYMTYILNTYIYGEQKDENVIKDLSELEHIGFESYIFEKVKPYIGKTQKELANIFSLTTTAKNVNELLLARMLGVTRKIANTEEFRKAGIVPKTVRIQKNGSIIESMSFPTICFKEIIKIKWEDSGFYDYLSQTKFLFIIFRENDDGDYIFDNLVFWNIPDKDLDEVGRVWARTIEVIKHGVMLEKRGDRVYNNLPKQTESPVAHVRPHTNRSAYLFNGISVGNLKDADELPDGRLMTKQCFWLNNSYVRQQIETKVGQK